MRELGTTLIILGWFIAIIFGGWYYLKYAYVYTYAAFRWHAITDYWYVYLVAFGLFIIGILLVEKS